MAFRTISVLLTANSSGLSSALRMAAGEIQGFERAVQGAGRNISTTAALMKTAMPVAGAAAAAGLAVAVKSAIDFETQMRNVNSITQASEAEFRAQSEAVLDLSRQLPQSAETLARGLYNIASSGFQGAEGLTVLDASARAASAGLADTDVAARGITAVLNAYGLEARDAADVSDVLFQTVNLGVISFEELAEGLGDVVGFAAAASISIDEVGSAIAAMTLAGIPANEAFTSLNRLIQELIKPTDALKALYQELGINITEDLANPAIGFYGVMEKLRDATGGTVDETLRLFNETRAVRGAFALFANEGENYRRTQEGIANAQNRSGATQRAFNEQMKAAGAQLQIFINNARAFGIAIGSEILPRLSAMAELGTKAVGVLDRFKFLGDAFDIFMDQVNPVGRALELFGITGKDSSEKVEKATEGATDQFAELGDQVQASGDATTKQILASVEAVKALQESIDKAGEAAEQAFNKDFDLISGFTEAFEAGKSPTDFFNQILADAQAFTSNISAVVAQGLDPAFVQRIFEAGPRQAAPLLQALAADHSGSLIDLANETMRQMDSISVSVIERARVTQQAIEATSVHMAEQFPQAMQILAIKARDGGKATVQGLAQELRIGEEEVRSIVENYRITAVRELGLLPPQAAAQGNFTGFSLKQALENYREPIRQVAQQFNENFKVGAAAMPSDAAHIGAETGGAMSRELLNRLGDFVAAVGGYANALAFGLNPILAGIGAKQIAVQAAQALFGQSRVRGVNTGPFATGGKLGERSEFRRAQGGLVEWAEPPTGGEYHLFVPRHGASDETKRLWMEAGRDLGMADFQTGGRLVGASMYGGPGDPTSGVRGYRGDDLRGKMAYAELGMGTALGNLPYRAALDINFNGRTVRGIKLDIGRGGGPVQGHPRAIDLWYETARALGFSGLGVVGINGAVGGSGGRGGFQTGADVPRPPRFDAYGNMLGYSAGETTQYAYNKAVDFVNAHPPVIAVDSGVIGPAMGAVGGGWQSIVAYLRGKGINPIVTSTFRPGDPGFHGRGKAVDMAGPMREIFNALGPGGGNPVPGINELFYDPMGFYYDQGRRISGAIGGHMDHVHAAVFRAGERITEDDPRWDWRTLRNQSRGVTITGQRFIEHASGRLTPRDGLPAEQGGWPLRYTASGEPYYSPYEGFISTASGGWAPYGSPGRPVAEDDPRFDWRTMGNRMRGLFVDDQYYDEFANGFLRRRDLDPRFGVKNRPGWWTQARPGVWIPTSTVPYPGVRGYAQGGMFNAGMFDRGGTLMPRWNAVYNGTGRPEKVVPVKGGDSIDYARLGKEVAKALRESPPQVSVKAINRGQRQLARARA